MRKNRTGVWRATGVVTALATAAAIASVAPAQAQTTAQLSAYVSDGWGGGTITSQPAGINCHQEAWDPERPAAEPDRHLHRELRDGNDGHLHRHARHGVLRQ
ncbi:hypothetical protein ACFZDI_16765 [Streptomyces sp. NPDC007907]|uniref:hypothetical protein n=1 Tax=Streptomyces sp. NPDC007907 TaxID=3364789 RepID=UPI0036ECB6BE